MTDLTPKNVSNPANTNSLGNADAQSTLELKKFLYNICEPMCIKAAHSKPKDNNVMSIFKEKEPVDSSVNLINSNSKSNLQNKQTNLIGVSDKTAKVKDNMKITENITNTYGNIRKNIDIKNNKEPTSKTKITKGEFPPKRNSNNNANSMNIMDSNIIIHQNKNSRKDFGENEKKSFTKEEFLNKEEEQKGTNQIIDEKQAIKDKIIQKKKVILSDYEFNHLI